MKKSIAWVFPPIGIDGSGGMRTLIDHAVNLSEIYNQTIYTQTKREDIERLYGVITDSIKVESVINESYDLAIATWWETAKIVKQINAKKKVYFLLDFEYMFYAMGSEYLQIIDTYNYGFIPVTMGKWLGDGFKTPYSLDFCVNKEIYKPLNMTRKQAVCFHYQPDKPRRCAKVGLQALKNLKQLMPELSIYLYSSEVDINDEIKNPEFINLGFLTLQEINRLYNVCQLGICFSPTNPSRIPFEMMAAGLPVLDLNIDNKIDFPKDLLYLTTVNNEEMVSNLYNILTNQEELNKRSKLGLEFMQNRNRSLEYKQFADIIGYIINEV